MLLGFSDSFVVIFTSRILDGVFGGLIPIIRAYIADITEFETRSTQMGGFTGIMAFGMIFSPAIGGLMGYIYWRIPPFIASALSLISILLTIKFLTESMPKERIRERKHIINLQKKKNQGRKQKILTKVIWLRLGDFFFVSFNVFIFNSSFSETIQTRYGLNFAHVGIFAAVAGILMIFFGVFLTKPLVSKFSEKKILILSIISDIFVSLMYPLMTEAWLLFIFVTTFVFSNVFSRTITMTTLSRGVDEHNQGIVNG